MLDVKLHVVCYVFDLLYVVHIPATCSYVICLYVQWVFELC